MRQATSKRAGAADYPALPGAMQRSQVEQLIRHNRRAIGLTKGQAEVLLAMMDQTRPCDWTSGSAEPVCFARQMTIAAITQTTTKTVRDTEQFLVSLGLASKVVADNGHRGSFAGGNVVHGIGFAPLIEHVPMLLDLAQAEAQHRQTVEARRKECSAARRVFRMALSRLMDQAPDHQLTAEAVTAFQELPRRYDGMDLQELEALLEHVDNMASKVLSELDLQDKISGTPEASFRLYIHDTTYEDSEICNASDVMERPACKQADVNSGDTAQSAAHGLETKPPLADRGHKPGITDSFSMRQIYAAASDDFRLYLDALKGDAPLPNALHLVRAAAQMLRELGINDDAWNEAVTVMGQIRAAVSVLIIDANRSHPMTPIHKPGGALRAFSRRDLAGQLNLDGSLIGLLGRTLA